MAQMAPLSWLNLFLSFISVFMIINTFNYLSFKYDNTASKTSPKLNKTNWNW